MENTVNNDNRFGMDPMKKIIYAMIAVIVVLVGVVIYLGIDNAGVKEEKEALIKDAEKDKEILTADIIALKTELDTLYSDYADINLQLDSSRMEVDLLIEKLTSTEATNRNKIRQYQAELGTLRDIMKTYVHQIDSLNNLNQQLKAENIRYRETAAMQKQKAEETQKKVEELEQKVSVGATIKASDIRLTAYSKRDRLVNRSSQTAYLVTELTIGANDLAEKGYITIYIRVKDANGILLTDPEFSAAFEYAGEQMTCSSLREIDYQGNEVDVVIYLHGVSAYQEGMYTVEAYANSALLGTAEMLLK